MWRILALLGVCLVLAEASKERPTKPPPNYPPNYNNVDYPAAGPKDGYYQDNYDRKIVYHKVDRCEKDSNCKPGLLCLNFWCVPVQCRKHKDCNDPRLACNRGRCVNRKRKCHSDKQCGKGYICVNSFCTFEQCWRDQDCGSGNRCDRNRCVNKPRCKFDQQCGRGRICEDTFCVRVECNKNADCLKQDNCYRGRCLADCAPCFFRDPKSNSLECMYKCQTPNEHCIEGACVCNFGYFRNAKKQCEIKPPPPPPPPPKDSYQGPGDYPPPYQPGPNYKPGPGDYPPPYQPGPNYKPGPKDCYDGRC